MFEFRWINLTLEHFGDFMVYMLLKNGTYESVSIDFVCGKTFVIITTEVFLWSGRVIVYLRHPDEKSR